MPVAYPALELMVSAHEGRLQHVEHALPELASSVERCSLNIEHLGDHLGGKMDELGTAMKEHAINSAQRTGEILVRVSSLEKAKEVADDALQVSDAKKQTLLNIGKKFALPVSVVGTAALVKFGEWLWSLLSATH